MEMAKKMVIDTRGMPPPGPAERIMEALARAEPGTVVEVIGDRPFSGVVEVLKKEGAEYELKDLSGTFILRITASGDIDLAGGDVKCPESMDVPEITEDTNVAALLEHHPGALDILIKYGFTPLKNPVTRGIMAPRVTLRSAADLNKTDERTFMKMMAELKALSREG